MLRTIIFLLAATPGWAIAAPQPGPASDQGSRRFEIVPRCGKACEALKLYSFGPRFDASRDIINPEPFDDEPMVAGPPSIEAPMPVIPPPNGEE
ncbi:MAG: hypothetical protein JO366_06330 [Methylobacteriaceae bacterium]|nr:hypothetical protein [Methylobacteriaceae bacterium]MBV9244412.1 hypothetical protein [Methylobacteriaceae bacterium]MBV9705600.1 hypothetical protein [Methylobacteriaceae bacterium]